MQINWLDLLYKLFDIAIIPILAAATMYVVSLIKAKKEEVLEKTKNERIKKYINMLDTTITDCVLATNQTYVKAIKEKGTFDAEAQKHAFQLTYDTVMAILTDDAKEYLTEATNDLNTYITNKIEAQVIALKQ